MSEIGIQSYYLIGKEPLAEDFAKVKAAGFSCLDFSLHAWLTNKEIYSGKLNHFFDADKEELCDFFAQYRMLAEEYGLKYSQVHTPYPVLAPGHREDADYLNSVTVKSLYIAAELGAPYAVVHPVKMRRTEGKAEEIEYNIRFFHSLVRDIEASGTMVCLENLYESSGGRLVPGVCQDPDEAVEYIDRLNHMAGFEAFGFCFDTGHANLFGINMEEFLLKLDHRLKILHIHDNDGREDLHQLPFSFSSDEGRCSTEWNGFIKGLQRIGFDGVINFETYKVIKSFPEELHDEIIKIIYDIGSYFCEKLAECESM